MDSVNEDGYASFSKAGMQNEIRFLARELATLQRSNREVQKGLTWSEGGAKSVQKNKTRAVIESAALELEYPQLTLIPQFPSFYRYLRAEELNGALSRGGEILLVGSGTTLYEALALSIEQPSQKKVEEIFSEFPTKINTLHRRRRLELQEASAPDSPPLLPHSVLAYEPDTRQTEGFEKANRFFHTQTTIVNQALKGLNRNFSKLFQNVVVNRADPAMLQRFPHLLSDLMHGVEIGGGFVATVGTGNGPEEFSQRRQFLDMLSEQLPAAGFEISSRLPRFMMKGDASFYGTEMMGAIIGRKKA